MRPLALEAPLLKHIAATLQTGASWWWQQMLTLWPISAFLKDEASQTVVVQLTTPPEAAQADEPLVLSADLEAISDQDIARLKDHLNNRPISILLDPSQIYVCTARFPKNALKAGSETIAYHLQTASPLPVEDITYDVSTRQDGDNVVATIAIARTSTIEDIIGFFAASGLPLDRVGATKTEESQNPEGGQGDYSFTFYQRLSFGQGLTSGRTALGLCLSLFLLPMLCALGAWTYGTVSARTLEARLETQRSSYAQDIRLTRSFDHYTDMEAELNTESRPDQLSQLIADLATATPRDAWLEQLSVDQSDVAIQGYSRNANDAANQLRSVPALSDIRLNRVTASGGASATPLFSIAAQWAACGGESPC